jgi:hypothetical protein
MLLKTLQTQYSTEKCFKKNFSDLIVCNFIW